MKNKIYTYTVFAILAILLASIIYCAGVSHGLTVAESVYKSSAEEVRKDVRNEVINIQETYNFEEVRAEGRCSGCSECGGGDGSMYVVMPFETSEPFVEISGIGLLPVKSGTAECIQIYFNNCEVAEKFGNEEVFVRMEE